MAAKDLLLTTHYLQLFLATRSGLGRHAFADPRVSSAAINRPSFQDCVQSCWCAENV